MKSSLHLEIHPLRACECLPLSHVYRATRVYLHCDLDTWEMTHETFLPIRLHALMSVEAGKDSAVAEQRPDSVDTVQTIVSVVDTVQTIVSDVSLNGFHLRLNKGLKQKT